MTVVVPPLSPALQAVCQAAGADLTGLVSHEGEPVNGPRLLLAIAGNESSFGRTREFVRLEAGYAPGGHYHTRSLAVQALWARWGVLAASSFGSFQVLYVTATEMGFAGHPIALQEDTTSAPIVARLIARRFVSAQGAKTLAEVFDAYNSGTARDAIVPADYIAKGLAYYEQLAGGRTA